MHMLESDSHPATDLSSIDEAIIELQQGAERLVTMPIARRKALLDRCLAGVAEHSQAWIERAWVAKKISEGDSSRAEDIMTGPLSTFRCLHLLRHTLTDIERTGKPCLPGKPFKRDGQVRVPVFPTQRLFDALLFGPLRAETWMEPGIAIEEIFGNNVERASGTAGDTAAVAVVLGAGNVSSIPIADALTKIFQENRSVILKMNPVNEYVGPILESAFAALVEENLFRVVYGGGEVGAQLTNHQDVAEIHITGSDRTHDAIVWGPSAEQSARKKANTPCIAKPITSELGNVSPWIIVPGKYTKKQLDFQAENIVASITNNVSFNCIATKMLVTGKGWPQRELLLNRIDELLARIPNRYAYYPGAIERFERFSGIPLSSEARQESRLPWTLIRDVDPVAHPHMFQEESFVCVVGETTIAADATDAFLDTAVKFANDEMWGTLSAAITVPNEFRKHHSDDLDRAIRELRYGTIGINQWPGVAYALMSPPWGAFPGSTLQDVQSGIGHVHNTYFLAGAEKTVVSSPLTMLPKPMWFSTHRCPEAVSRNLLKLYERPSIWRVPAVLFHALRG